MDCTISFKPDLSYYQEAYSEIIKTNRLKQLEPVFGIILWASIYGLERKFTTATKMLMPVQGALVRH